MDTKRMFRAQDDEKLSYPSPAAQFLSFLVPLAATGAIVSLLYVIYGYAKVVELFSLALATFFAFGKFIVFAPLIPLPDVNFTLTFSIFQLAAMVAYMDTVTAIVVRYNLFMFEKIRGIGPKIKAIRHDCFYLLKANPWMRKIASIAVVAFVAFPIAGTGAIAGSFLSYMLGMRRLYSVLMVCLGGIVGSYGMAFGALAFQKNLKDFLENPLVMIAGIVAALAVLVWGSWKMKQMIERQKKLEHPETATS